LNLTKLRHPFHLVAGLLSALSVSVSPVLPLVSTLLFLTYEIDEDWHIKDRAYLDIFEYMLAFFIGISLMLGIDPQTWLHLLS
jgi:hypothetical protein